MFSNRRCSPFQMGCGEQNRECGCGCQPQPIMEPAINKCVEREYCHEVQHIQPIHTHIVNKHIYKHTCTPQYTCSEENQVINLCNGGNNQFGQFR